MRLTDRQWAVIENLLPKPRRKRRAGRPLAANRACVEGILRALRTGARWRDLPSQYPSLSTCWWRLRAWEEQGVWLRAWRALLGTLDQRGPLRGKRLFWMRPSSRPKKGARSWQNAARQGHESRGVGRWPGYTSGNLRHICLAERGDFGRTYPGPGAGTATPTWTTTHATATHRCRSWLRQRPTAPADAATWH